LADDGKLCIIVKSGNSIGALPVHVRTLLFAFTAALVAATACAPAPLSPTPAPQVTFETSPEPATPVTPAGPITLTYWEEDGDAADVLLDELSAAFTAANPEITVQRKHFSYDDLRNQFRAESLFAGEVPDLVRAPGEFTGPFGELRIVKALDEIYAADFFDDYLSGALAGATLGATAWGLPDNYGGHLMLLYNKALVAQVPLDTDAWVAQLKTLTDSANGQYGLVFDTTESYWLIPWLGGFGGWPLDAQEKPALDTAEMIEALWFLHDLKFERRVMPDKVDYQFAYDLFSQGKAAYVIDGAWNLDRYTGLGVDVGIALLPRVSKTKLLPAPMATGRYWFIAKGVEGAELDAAARFVEFMTSAQTQESWLTKMRRLPSSKTVLDSAVVKSDPVLSPMAEQLRLTRGVPPALEMACAWRGMGAYFGKVMAGEISADDAAPAMQQVADDCVADMIGEDSAPE
jgi:arabinogalactan oligomer/maltooligosaccharide transport system substrate-binding protein